MELSDDDDEDEYNEHKEWKFMLKRPMLSYERQFVITIKPEIIIQYQNE